LEVLNLPTAPITNIPRHKNSARQVKFAIHTLKCAETLPFSRLFLESAYGSLTVYGAPLMKPDLLTFQFAARTDVAGNMLGAIVNKLNSRDWMGKPPRTCRVVKLHIKGKPGGVAEGYIIVRHRPHGWKIRQVSQDEQGHLLDDEKHPLPDGAEPIIIEFDPLEEVDFNGFDFGRLVA
jgi:hypothetical protein